VIDIQENTVGLVTTMALISVAAVLLLMVVGSHEHGMLMDPVNRSSMWRKGYNTPANYEDNQLFCGGRSVSLNVYVQNVLGSPRRRWHAGVLRHQRSMQGEPTPSLQFVLT
jgi:hypothetical protein